MTEVVATPEAATARLTELTQDKAWSGKLLANDPTTVGEFHALSQLAAAEPEPAPAPSSVEEIAAASAKAINDANTADFVKGVRDRFPVSDDVIGQVTKGESVSAAERDLAIHWLNQLAGDKERSAKLLGGDLELRRHLFSASVLMASPVKDGETAKSFTIGDLLKIGAGQSRDVRSQL